MKKLLLAVAFVFALALPMAQPAHAFGGAAFAVLPTPLAVGTTLAPGVIFALIATNTPFPLCGFQGLQCEGTYPQDPKRATDYYNPQTVAYHPVGNPKPHYIWVNGVKTIRSDGQ